MGLYSTSNVSNSIITYEKGKDVLLPVNAVYTYQVSDGDTYHVIEEQDTLEELANRYYKDSTLWYILARCNMLVDIFELEVGTQLIIPKIN